MPSTSQAVDVGGSHDVVCSQFEQVLHSCPELDLVLAVLGEPSEAMAQDSCLMLPLELAQCSHSILVKELQPKFKK